MFVLFHVLQNDNLLKVGASSVIMWAIHCFYNQVHGPTGTSKPKLLQERDEFYFLFLEKQYILTGDRAACYEIKQDA